MRDNSESQNDFLPGLRRARAAMGADPYAVFRDRVQRRLLTDLSPVVDTSNVVEVRRALEHIFNEALAEERLPISRTEREELFEQIVADVLGFGPIEPLLRDDSITEIMVNGPSQVYIERNGILDV